MEGHGTFGRYSVLARLGEASDAVLIGQWAAEAGFARLVIIKSLFPDSEKARLVRHLEPARRAAGLHHPNVRQIHELDSAAGSCYLAVEYLEGVTYDYLLRGRNRSDVFADPRLHAGLLAQACEGLHHAHSRLELLHNGLRPNRLFVTSGGTVKILGLGLSELDSATATAATLADAAHYAYMSPEQILGRPTDARSDVFAMGIIAWEALTGRRLFARTSRTEVYRAITDQQIPRPGRLARGLPAKMDAAVSRALAKAPDDRFRTSREFGLALEEGVTEIGAPLSTVAIASAVDTWFGRELESQRNMIQRARQQLSSSHSDDDEAFDVPTRLFEGGFDPVQPTEQIDARDLASIIADAAGPADPMYPPVEAPESEGEPQRRQPRQPRRQKATSAPPPAREGFEGNGAPEGRTGFARPPETLSDVSDIADVKAALANDFERVGPADDPGAPMGEVKPGGARGWLIALVLVVLLAAAGVSGYYYWQQMQADKSPAPVSTD